MVDAATLEPHLLIFGASTRAAAFSALRADLRPWCVDLHADRDLRARCPARTIAPENYPAGFVQEITEAPPGPWMYTGALENRLALVQHLANQRPLWGNGTAVLAAVRSPNTVHNIFRAVGIACPAIFQNPAAVPAHGQWLIKPLLGAGGQGIRLWQGEPIPERS